MSDEAMFWRMEAERHAAGTSAVTCSVCDGSGILRVPEPDGSGLYETACPDPAHDGQRCPECGGNGYIESDRCNCGTGPSGYYGMHERHCGLEPCPRGCPFIAPGAARPQEEAPF
jgi:hypothetical protein